MASFIDSRSAEAPTAMPPQASFRKSSAAWPRPCRALNMIPAKAPSEAGSSPRYAGRSGDREIGRSGDREIGRVAKKAKRSPASANTMYPNLLLDQFPDEREAQDWDVAYQRNFVHWAIKRIRHEFGENGWESFVATAIFLKRLPRNSVSPPELFISPRAA